MKRRILFGIPMVLQLVLNMQSHVYSDRKVDIHLSHIRRRITIISRLRTPIGFLFISVHIRIHDYFVWYKVKSFPG
jgi:hypothetical protein